MDAREVEREIQSPNAYDRLYERKEIDKIKERVQEESAKLVVGIIVRNQMAPWETHG